MIDDDMGVTKSQYHTILKNYSILVVGLFIMAFGVALSVKSDLGTTPISCIPNVLSFGFDYSLGNITIAFNTLLVIMQIFILKRKFKVIQLMQVFVTVIFGYFIDFALYVLTFLNPTDPINQWILCIVSCFIIALGVFFEVNSNAVVLPGEGVILAISEVTNMEFGKVKSLFDSSNVVIGALISLYMFASFKGIGLGTIFAGIVVGYIVRFYKRIFEHLL